MTFDFLCEKYLISSTNIISQENKHIIFYKKTEYLQVLKFQQDLNTYVYNNPDQMFFIITSHPNIFTMGKGIQKKTIEKHNLTELIPYQLKINNIPIINIKRGGGLTFHHLNQFILYPIIHITHHRIKILSLIEFLLETTKKILENHFQLNKLNTDYDLLGLWIKNKKIASVGVQLNKFVSMHGLALNYTLNKEMKKGLSFCHPCGLLGTTYTGISEQFDANSRKFFEELFIKEIFKAPLFSA